MSRMMGAESKVLKYDGSTAVIPVASGATIYTRAFDMGMATFFGIFVKATSTTGTPDIKVELQEGPILPVTEGSVDDYWTEPDGFSDIFDQINDELAHIKTISPVPAKYGRYKITGINANPADTTVEIYNFMQEQA